MGWSHRWDENNSKMGRWRKNTMMMGLGLVKPSIYDHLLSKLIELGLIKMDWLSSNPQYQVDLKTSLILQFNQSFEKSSMNIEHWAPGCRCASSGLRGASPAKLDSQFQWLVSKNSIIFFAIHGSISVFLSLDSFVNCWFSGVYAE